MVKFLAIGLGYLEIATMKSILVNRNFQIWLLIGWWLRDQPIRSHVRTFFGVYFQMMSVMTFQTNPPVSVKLHLILFCGMLCFIQPVQSNFNITFAPTGTSDFTESDVTIHEHDDISITFNVTCDNDNTRFENTTIILSTDADHIARISANSTIDISEVCSGVSVSFGVRGVRLGRAYVIASIHDEIISNYYSVIVLRTPRMVDDLFRKGMIILSSILYIGFGCKIRIEAIKEILMKPVAPAVGALCQFIIMPLVSNLTLTIYHYLAHQGMGHSRGPYSSA